MTVIKALCETNSYYMYSVHELKWPLTGADPGGGAPFRKFRKKNTRGGVQFEILRNAGIDFYSGSGDPKKSRYRLL